MAVRRDDSFVSVGKWSALLALARGGGHCASSCIDRFPATMVTLCGLALLSLIPVIAQGHATTE